MHGMSFREHLEFNKIGKFAPITLEEMLVNHVKIALDITNKVKILPLFADYLRHGYYPFYQEVKDSYEKVLQQVAANIIEVDVPAVESIEYSTVTKLKRLFALISGNGDFLVDTKFTFEVGGKNKSFDQIKGITNSYLALDDIETGLGAKIPLWLFGFIE